MFKEIAPTDSTPKIILDFLTHNIEISGESYPEDVNAFYGEVMEQIKKHVTSSSGISLTVNMNLRYFNSSSTKVFYNLFQMLEEATERNSVTVNWHYNEDDDMSLETGEGFQEDVEHIIFNFIPYK